eukprot:TRINITY_DN3449_c0_g2_i1.p1 TRINITY_DN3449_c0_g2~~TRINITY_DN3449_c0_g2_i1.p1  ORF type:complete len:373 (+),score=88.67 TRINITY_DN3449_c0_g2_i1:52-1170(+)
MAPTTSGVLSPVTIGEMNLKNRVVMAPLTRSRTNNEGKVPNDLNVEYYTQRATAGLIITEGTHVSPIATGWVDAPGIYTQEQVEGWKKVIKSIHEAGGKVFCQLWHQGRQTHSDFHGQTPVSSSATPMTKGTAHTPEGTKPYETPRPLEVDEIAQTVRDFGRAAANAKAAGFDGVEIHGANGYLLDQFMQSRVNKRTDEYGGSVEKRTRFVLEVIDAVLEVFPKEQVGIRVSPNGMFGDMGSDDFREQFTHSIKAIGEKNLGYVCVLDGLSFGFHEKGKPFLLTEAKALLEGSSSLLMGNVGYTKESADEAISSGVADLIAFGRPFITNPDLVERFQNGHELAPLSESSFWWLPNVGAEGYTTPERFNKSQL